MMYFAILVALTCLAYITINVVRVLVRNYKAHQFFQKVTPQLPVVPKPSLFSGHLYDVILQDKNWLIIHKLHEQYGTNYGLYHTDQAVVCTKDLDLIKLIEHDKPRCHINRAKFGIPFREFNKSLFQIDDDEWQRQRRAIAPAFTNHKVRSKEVTADIEAILKLVEDGINFKMVDRNGGERSTILDIGDMFLRFSFKVIHTIVWGHDVKINFRAKKDSWSSRINMLTKALNHPFVTISIIFPFTRPLLEFFIQYHNIAKGYARMSAKTSAKIMAKLSANMSNNKVVERVPEMIDRNQPTSGRSDKLELQSDIISDTPNTPTSVLEEEDSNGRHLLLDTMIKSIERKRIKQDELIYGLFALLIAGFQTTADTITCLVWHLARYPHIQERLRNSILDEGIDSEYLGWCIKETIRIHPAVPLGAGRILGEDVTVNGLFLPKGTYVSPSIYSIHHDPNIWPEPEQFKPERWRDTSGHHPAAFMGFGLGPRNCVGGRLAMHEIKLATRLMLTNYKIENCSDTPDEYAFSSPMLIFTTLDRPIKVRLVALNESACN